MWESEWEYGLRHRIWASLLINVRQCIIFFTLKTIILDLLLQERVLEQLGVSKCLGGLPRVRMDDGRQDQRLVTCRLYVLFFYEEIHCGMLFKNIE